MATALPFERHTCDFLPWTTSAKHRVVHVGTGLTGREALRGIIDDPALDLVGLGEYAGEGGRRCGRCAGSPRSG